MRACFKREHGIVELQCVLVVPNYVITLSPVEDRSQCCDKRVCLYVYLLAYLENRMAELYQIFCSRCLLPWLGPPLAALSCVLLVLWVTSLFSYITDPMAACNYRSSVVHGLTPLLLDIRCILS